VEQRAGIDLVGVTDRLVKRIAPLRFGSPVTHIYNPLIYAREPYDLYLTKYGAAPKEVVLLGMNPGPFGMAQTGVPFGDVHEVRNWLGIEAPVGKPAREHPKRPVEGFGCRRREVSGQRVWGWARARFGSPQRFFDRFFIANYCPLLFLEATGRNRTPDRLAAREQETLFPICGEALRRTVEILAPRLVVGIGAFAGERSRTALDGLGVRIGRMAHPSPANPSANRGWEAIADRALEELGVRI
jgi:single-strand selective monofunctional uracil DNA glycosylase